MPNLEFLSIDDNRIPYLPRWIIHLSKLNRFTASATPCCINQKSPNLQSLHSRPFILVGEPKFPQPRLTDLAASKIRDYIDKGGDWTDLQHLPEHLLKKIESSYPLGFVETQVLQFGRVDAFVVEKINLEELKGTLWSLCGKPWVNRMRWGRCNTDSNA